MGTNNIPAAQDSTTIPADHHNKIRQALIGDHVPRNAAANPEDEAGSMGTSAFRWIQGFFKTLFIGETGDNISLYANGGNLMIAVGGNVRMKIPQAHDFMPAGMVMSYAGVGDVGTEWLLCDGRELNRITYAKLFTAIGVTHGEGNGTSTFNIPDYRGRFLRGTDNMGTAQGAAGRDPDTGGRTAMNTGGNGAGADQVGSVQGDEFKQHNHGWTGPTSRTQQFAIDDGALGFNSWVGSNASDTVGNAGTSSETRPKNAYVNFLIKT